ncbi:hypothetical protein F3Y22_tig00111132pilonHSYRG00122 [Hibiscus syriacus]|uniref:CCHC-type domain-containing protein n=1 Tax=Hibiscus syriacus TaxID=106335 RepID=A0A6A2YYP1_HIBSY|nr:hypothetical protein F3Y22_tig00111132pilonHSYRG00122 [Hibiscus syriacus]
MDEDNPLVTTVSQAGETTDQTNNGNKRFRPSGGEEATEERTWTRFWSDTVADSPIFTGIFQGSSIHEEEEYESEEKEEIVSDDIPTVKIPKEIKEKIRKPWKKALIIKLLGKSIAYKTLISRITAMWNLESDFDCIDLGNGYYVVKFQSINDRLKVLTGGPWYLTVQKRKPFFFFLRKKRLFNSSLDPHPGLPIEYFDEGILVNIGKLEGAPFKVDYRATWATRGRFARICVEIDLRKPLLSNVRLGKFTFNIEYEGLHMICFKCGMVGHKEDQCPIRHLENVQQETTQEMQKEDVNQEAQTK